MELRALVNARNAPQAWDLRCEIRDKLVAFMRAEMPEALPRDRADVAIPPADVLARPHKSGNDLSRFPARYMARYRPIN